MSKYTDDMKRALVTYKEAKQKTEQRLQEVKEYYGDEGTRQRTPSRKRIARGIILPSNGASRTAAS